MEELRHDIDRAFQNVGFLNEPSFRTAFLPGRAARRYPLMNLAQDHEHVYIEALAPGLDPSAIDLSVVRNVLTISGEKRRHPQDIKPEAFHRNERAACDNSEQPRANGAQPERLGLATVGGSEGSWRASCR